jgi:diguanylate cyclase (GGDEF)-like protein
VAQIEDISERRATERQLRNLADRDPLTGLWNRRVFDEALGAQVLRSRLSEELATLLMIDLNGFKQINDTHGHAVGDHLLKAVADAILQRVRSSDLAARLGGDEFAVLLANTTPATVASAVAAIDEAISRATVATATTVVRPSASIGAAVINQQTSRPQDVLEAADRAMYEAKFGARPS